MKKPSFQEAVEQILVEDSRYSEDAYVFIREALDFTIKEFEKPRSGPGRHVRGGELLEGIRVFAMKEYGPMALSVLNHWGIQSTMDFGEVVFHLVDKGVLGKTEDDRREDFADGYSFDEAFRKPFRATNRKSRGAHPPQQPSVKG